MKHTPTANEVLTKLAGVLHRIPQAERDIIITACNSHDEPVNLLKIVEQRIQQDKIDNETTGDGTGMLWAIHDDICSALKSAGVSL